LGPEQESFLREVVFMPRIMVTGQPGEPVVAERNVVNHRPALMTVTVGAESGSEILSEMPGIFKVVRLM